MVLHESFNTVSFTPVYFTTLLIDISNILSNMARCKKQFYELTQIIYVKPEGIVNNSMIAVHKYNVTLFAEFLAASVNNCIHAPANGYNMRMTQLERAWLDVFDQIVFIIILLEINNEMTFFSNNDYNAWGGLYPQGKMVMWVDYNIPFKTNCEMIDNQC